MKLVFLVSALIVVAQVVDVESVAVNVALNKPIDALVSCGTYGKESYNLNSEIGLNTADRQELFCENATIPIASDMVDGDVSTQWQSSSRFNIYTGSNGKDRGIGDPATHLEAIVDLDLEQAFQVERIQFDMQESVRPGRIRVLKSLDGLTYQPWLHKVLLPADCNADFGVEVQSRPTDLSPFICTQYASSSQSILGGLVEFDISLESYTFRQARYIRVEFFEMGLILGVSGNSFQHYTVRELTIMSECSCYGHDIACEKSNVTGKFECICGENTEGEYCDVCKPFFKQQNFVADIPCEQCNCFSHSDSCYYDAAVADGKLSLNAQGVRSGGGVCISCQNNTSGINCETCSSHFYRPNGRPQTALDACIPCDCQLDGVTISPANQVGDCVVNSESPEFPNKAPGDCYCKANVQGSRCDQCIPGFYNLRSDNFLGCTDCGCFTAGTISNSPICNANATGQCPCKAFVMGRQCDTCQDGYFNLTFSNANGCDHCGCDPGGVNGAGCDKFSGQCFCKSRIIGRQCGSVEDGYFYPELHYIYTEVETPAGNRGNDPAQGDFTGIGYAILNTNDTISSLLDIPANIPSSQKFSLVFRYKANSAITGEVTLINSIGTVDSSPVTFISCLASWCYLQVGGDKMFTMTALSRYTVTLRVSGDLLLDRLVAIPQEFLSPTVLGTAGPTFRTDCRVLENAVGLSPAMQGSCPGKIYSVVVGSLTGALPCECHLVGSSSNVCDKIGGQCPCRPGVTGRKCDHCQADHFLMTFEGCMPCNCAGANKLCDEFSGQCFCSPNTQGRQCDQCQPNHYKWTEAGGCTPCDCGVGSAHLQCNATTGVCDCSTGVVGEKCNQCADDYKLLSQSGCINCDCNPVGSVSPVCNKTSGQCVCKGNTNGLLCNQCIKPGSFNLEDIHPKGCADCVCMGVTNVCSSSSALLKPVTVPLLDELSPDLTSFLTLVTAAGADSGVQITGERRPIDPFLVTNLDGTLPLFWNIDTGGLVGNVLGLYGSYIEFDLSYNQTGVNGNLQPLQVQMFYAQGLRLTQNLNVVLDIDVQNLVKLRVMESGWVTPTGGGISRADFLLALTTVQSWRIPATLLNVPHQTRLSNVRYTIASPGQLSGQQAVNVEQCECGVGYQGWSCELCAPGYKRVNASTHTFLGLCEPCSCNGHSNECNPDTGECLNCQQNTQGVSCEQCLPGYYGAAVLGAACVQCPCYAPRITDPGCEVNNGTVRCLNCNTGYEGALCNSCKQFFYGQPEIQGTGTCTACNCNGNSQGCDRVNGACLDCGSNTTGHNCERCLDEFYGNASIQNCQACGCSPTGRLSKICNHESGQCQCLPGVGGRICDSCMVGYWGYTDATFQGCQDCQCNPQGSITIQCEDATAICPCLPNVQGDRCDTCAPGFWGLPDKACSACACDANGSLDPSAPCDDVSGQCGCKPGVEGRQCNVCQRLYSGSVEVGCTKCGQCQESLGNAALTLEQTWTGYWSVAADVGLIQDQDMVLHTITADLTRAETDLGIADLTVGALQAMLNSLNSQEITYTTDVQNIQTRLEDTLNRCLTLHNDTITEGKRLNGLVTDSNTAMSSADAALTKARNNVTYLENYKNSANSLLNNTGIQTVDGGITFAADKAIVDEEFAAVQNVSEQVTAAVNKVDSQDLEATALEQRRNSLQTESGVIKSRVDAVQINNAQLTSAKQAVESLLQNAQARITVFDDLVNSTTATLNNARVQLQSSNANFQTATSVLQDCALVLGDNPNNTPLPLDTTVDISGIRSWPVGYRAISSALNQTLLDIRTVDGNSAVTLASSLQTQAVAIQRDFQQVEPLGREAVAAKVNYENAVKSLSDSMMRAQEASQTINQQTQSVAGVNLVNLENSAVSSREQSDGILNQANSNNYQPSVLQSQLQGANSSLQNVIVEWNGIVTLVDTVSAQALTLDPVNKGNDITNLLDQAESSSTFVTNSASLTLTNDQSLSASLDTYASESVIVQNQSASAVNVVNVVEAKVRSYNDQLLRVERLLEQGNNIYNQIYTDGRQANINDRLTNLAARIDNARQLASGLKQPVSFNRGNPIVAQNPVALRDEFCNRVSLEFKAPIGSSGLLLFAEDSNTAAEFSLELINGSVVFHFAINFERVQMTSPAEIGNNEWARVEASRCGNSGQLSVTLVSTGATSMTYRAGVSLNARFLQLSSGLFLGGLPAGYETLKVSQTDFQGCLYKVMYDTQEIPIWDLSVMSGEARCCRKPVYFDPIPTGPGISLSGFGHLQLPAPGINIVGPSEISVKFRTFTSSGVLFIIDDLTGNFYSVYLLNGQVVFDISAGNNYRITSEKRYNDGAWYMITTVHNSTHQELQLQYGVNGSFFMQEVLSSVISGLDLTSLVGKPITFGSRDVNPSSSSVPVSSKLAGAIVDYQYGVQRGTRTSQPLNANVISQAEVYPIVPQQVQSGLTLYSDFSYAEMSLPEQTTIQSISLYFTTYDPNGVLIYGASRSFPDVLIYIALRHGNIVVYYNENSGGDLRGPVETTGLFLSDGVLHSIKVEILSTFRVQLSVDDILIQDNVQIFYNTIALGASSLYLGGINNIPNLSPMLPVRDSLKGGITSLFINTGTTNLLDLSRYTGHSDISLAGVAKPRAAPIPPPVTIPPNSNIPTSCLQPTPSGRYSEVGVRFGDSDVSFQKHQLSFEQMNALSGSFVLSIQFRSFTSNGILFYMADQLVDPSSWFSVYLQEGYITVSMSSSTGNPQTTRLRSQLNQYRSGTWWEVDVLRINDFLAIVVSDQKDYINNNVNSSIPSVLPFNTPLFIGGLDSTVNGNIKPAIEIEKTPLIGCIRRVEITPPVDIMPPYTVDLKAPQATGGTSKCFSNVASGVRMSGMSSYLSIVSGSSYSFQVPFQFSVTIRTTSRSGNLFTIYQSQEQFVVLDIFQGQIRCMIGNPANINNAFIVTANEPTNAYTLCNNEPHTINLEITSTELHLKVGTAVVQVEPFPVGFTPAVFTGFFFVGGFKPEQANNVVFPVSASRSSFKGCLDKLTISGQYFDPQFIQDKSGVNYGCFL